MEQRRIFYNPQLAYVLLAPVLDRGRFGEKVAQNRGMLVKVFDNLAEAESWLQIIPSLTLA